MLRTIGLQAAYFSRLRTVLVYELVTSLGQDDGGRRVGRPQVAEMDADVKGSAEILLLSGHGGGGCWGLATGVRLSTTVTLRCAGRDRRTVSVVVSCL